MTTTLKAPFPYFGGKSRAVSIVWPRFGEVRNYVEPFCGSLAMLLGAPEGKRIETVNDWSGFICNFWRSIKHDPVATAHWADWPVIENDLEARHGWLVNHADELKANLNNPDYYDAKIAGWWVWGVCAWIGSGWCSGNGPWQLQGDRLIDARKLIHVGGAGRGINRQLVHVGDAGQGINRKLIHLGGAGQGINRKLVHVGDAGRGIQADAGELSRSEFISQWFTQLSERIRDVRVCCGDWSRVCTPVVTNRNGLTAVFLDPPYDAPAMDHHCYTNSKSVNTEVTAWCIENQDNPLMRIALCGYDGEYDLPDWTVEQGRATNGGYSHSTDNSKRERIWFSPHCVAVEKQSALFAQ